MKFRLAVYVMLGLCPLAAAGEDPPYQRMLQGDDATKAAALEKRIDELREAGGFKEAQAVARTLLDLRSLVQGENHWQTDDAGRLVGTLEKIAALSADAQAEVAKAKKAARAASQLERQLKFAKAAPLRRQQL